jgi:hypothetical protein
MESELITKLGKYLDWRPMVFTDSAVIGKELLFIDSLGTISIAGHTVFRKRKEFINARICLKLWRLL